MDEATRSRFWARVDVRGLDECWPWTGPINNCGYGVFYWTPPDAPMIYPPGHRRRRRQSCTTASRFAHMLDQDVESLPGNIEVCHTCDNPPCVNPAHLFPGTASDNQIDSLRKGRKGKLSPAQVRMIRASDEPTAFEAARYGVTEDMIRKIRRGTSWHTLDNAA